MALVAKNPPANAGDLREVGLIPDLEAPLDEGMATHGECHGQRSLGGYSPWGCKESGTTERARAHTHTHTHTHSTQFGQSTVKT